MAAPLLERLRELRDEGPLRMHMPGHKGRLTIPELEGLAGLDFTELPPTGDLFAGEGPVMEAQALWAGVFGMDCCLFLTGGATQGIHAALTLAAAPGGTVLADRDSHRSVYHAMALLDLRPVYLRRPWWEAGGVPGPVIPSQVENVLKNHPEIKTVCITSPSYYGVLSDVEKIGEICRRFGCVLVVDGAHGAHLPFLGMDCLQGADLAVVSAHKTLPAPGQTALLLARGREQRELRRAGSLYGSSSPSYPLMAGLDACRDWMEREGAARYRETIRLAARLRRRFAALEEAGGVRLDPGRLVLWAEDGHEAMGRLQALGIYPEMADARHVVCILTCQDGAAELERLERGLEQVLSGGGAAGAAPEAPPPPLPALTPRQALLERPRRRVSLEAAEGLVCAQQVAPYPPGVPVLAPGEEITKKHLAYLQKIGYNTHKDVDVVENESPVRIRGDRVGPSVLWYQEEL